MHISVELSDGVSSPQVTIGRSGGRGSLQLQILSVYQETVMTTPMGVMHDLQT